MNAYTQVHPTEKEKLKVLEIIHFLISYMELYREYCIHGEQTRAAFYFRLQSCLK